MGIITIENLYKIYAPSRVGEGKEALKDISLTIPKGSIFGLLGPNGAGKSTLINILAGLVLKSSGKITIDGIDQDVDPRATRYKLGIVPQEVVLDPFFNVREALEYYAGYFGVPKTKRQTDALLKAMHLEDKANVGSRRLSGGMKRRVLIAKALVHNPAILVLDEPTAGVDVELRAQLWDYVQELNAKGTTILLTTHYLEEAESLCDNIAIINHGKIVANDSKDNLLHTLDKKCLRITTIKPLEAVPKSLQHYDVTIADNQLLLNYSTKNENAGALLSAVHDAGIVVQDIATEEADLEDVFKHLVS